MKDLLNSEEPLTLDRLREFIHENDFLTMPVKDPSEYSGGELELYNVVLKHINAEWQEISKSLGLNHPQDCYSKDFPARTHQGQNAANYCGSGCQNQQRRKSA